MRAFVAAEIMPFCHEWDEAKQLPRMLYTKMASQNLHGAIVGSPFPLAFTSTAPILGVVDPKEYDYFHWFIVYDELARTGSGISTP